MNNYGIIIHYGLYSYYAYDNPVSAKKRNVQNGSEWYYGRLIDKNNFRPISGQSYTKKYHNENFPDVDYFDNIDKILQDKKMIENWVKLCKKNGAKFIILTSKHHDGICLWDTKTTDRKSMLDICKYFSEYCKKHDIEFGFYYSWFEFDKSFTVQYFENICVPQINELLKYSPKHFWFDGQWKIKQKKVISEIHKMVKKMVSDGMLVNDRIGGDDFSVCSYRVFADRYIPEEKVDKWQHVNTIGLSWGYNKQTPPEDYKTGEEIFDIYKKITSLGGELLLNLGPDITGNICKEEMKSLQDFFKLIKNEHKQF
jgi:alpha-L-fucosidase